jgi:hypothetical protein
MMKNQPSQPKIFQITGQDFIRRPHFSHPKLGVEKIGGI